MAIVLNKKAVEQAEANIKSGEITSFDSDWEGEKPTIDEITYYLKAHTNEEYGTWYLGINTEVPKNLQEYYEYPYGDLKTVQRSALVDTIKRAEQKGHQEIVNAAKRLLEMVDAQANK